MADAMVAPGGLVSSRPKADVLVRRLLLIPDNPRRRSREVHRLFSVSMAISGVRCLLSYIVLPVLAPVIGAASGIEPYLGVPLSVIALFFDVKGLRRFWVANHRYRWEMTFVYVAVIGLVLGLLVMDLVKLAHE